MPRWQLHTEIMSFHTSPDDCPYFGDACVKKRVSRTSVEKDAAKTCLPNLMRDLTPVPQAP